MIIAVVGMPGSGKSKVVSYLEKKNYTKVRFGDVTDNMLKKKNLEFTEENEKEIRESIRKKMGMDAYAKLNLERLSHLKDNVVIDGLYSWEELVFLKKHFPKLVVLAVYAPPETRYERLLDREQRSLTREQAISRDIDEIENLHKAGPIAIADYTLMNVWNPHDLADNIDKFFEWINENIKN